MIGRNPLAVAIALLLLFALPPDISAQELVIPGQILNFPPAVRSYGLGLTGTADMNDPTNAHFNPALLVSANGLYLGGSTGEILQSFESEASILDIGLTALNKSYSRGSKQFCLVGSIRYGRLDYGDLTELTTEDEPFTYHAAEQSICLTVAGGLTASDIYHVGVGVSLKPVWSSGYESDYFGDLDYRKLAVDVGLILAWDTYKEKGFLIRPSIGLSLVNMGTDIVIDETNYRLSKRGRFGIGLELEFPGLESWNQWTGVETPLITIASNLDIVYDWGNRLQQNYLFDTIFVDYSPYWYPRPDEFTYMFGLELGVMQALFLRWGYLEDKTMPADNNTTYGMGIGATYKRFSGRLDWARIHQRKAGYYNVPDTYARVIDGKIDRYGFTLSIRL